MCKHGTLEVKTPEFTGVNIDLEGKPIGVCGMFMYRKYTCLECGKTITVLSAVISEE